MVATNQNQWALKWPYTQPGGALPVVNDTGGQWGYTPNTMPGSVDYGAGQQGAASAYTGNPWQNYNDPASNSGWNFTQDPLFNAGADKPTWDLAQTGAKSETDRARVWRWTLDQLKGQGLDPGSAPQATVQAAYLGNIARLKRDYAANGMNWQGSAYAGYDKYLPGGGGTGVGGGTTGATQQGGARGGGGQVPGVQSDPNTRLPGSSLPNGGMMYDQGQGQTGGSTVNPPYGQGAVTGAQSAGVTTQPGGSTPPTPNPNPTGGQGQYGGAGFVNAADPQSVVRQYMQSHGMNPDSNGFLSGYIQQMMGSLIPAIMKLTLGANGKPALDRLGNINQLLDPIFYGGGGTLGGNLQGFANQVQGQLPNVDMAGMKSSDQADLLRNLMGLQTVGDNHYLGTARNNRLDAAINAASDQQYNLAQQGQDPGNYSLWDFIQKQLPQGRGLVNPFR